MIPIVLIVLVFLTVPIGLIVLGYVLEKQERFRKGEKK